jgi:hypothetical protein
MMAVVAGRYGSMAPIPPPGAKGSKSGALRKWPSRLLMLEECQKQTLDVMCALIGCYEEGLGPTIQLIQVRAQACPHQCRENQIHWISS